MNKTLLRKKYLKHYSYDSTWNCYTNLSWNHKSKNSQITPFCFKTEKEINRGVQMTQLKISLELWDYLCSVTSEPTYRAEQNNELQFFLFPCQNCQFWVIKFFSIVHSFFIETHKNLDRAETYDKINLYPVF